MPSRAKKKPKSKKKPVRKRRATDLHRAIRWTLSRAAREFGIHRELMERQRRALHIEPGEDERFSTRQITAMAFGDKQLSDAKRAAAEAESAERRNAREASELITVNAAVAALEPIMVLIRQEICGLPIDDADKDRVLAHLFAAKELDWEKVAKEGIK